MTTVGELLPVNNRRPERRAGGDLPPDRSRRMPSSARDGAFDCSRSQRTLPAFAQAACWRIVVLNSPAVS
jgi:hypothetical protein